jgi:uncharacterized protein YktA (UPF0223 family)
MTVKNIIRENDVGSYNKLMKIKDKKKEEKLSDREIEDLMSHSSYKRHKGAMKQVREWKKRKKGTGRREQQHQFLIISIKGLKKH